MGRLLGIGKTRIVVYGNDHLPPHFHVVSPDVEALIAIETMAIIKGELPRALRAAVMDWAHANRAAIAAEWNRINPRFPIAG